MYVETLKVGTFQWNKKFPLTYEEISPLASIAWQNNIYLCDSMRWLDMEDYLVEMNTLQRISNQQPTMIGTKKDLIAFYNDARELRGFANLFCNIETINDYECLSSVTYGTWACTCICTIHMVPDGMCGMCHHGNHAVFTCPRIWYCSS